jgi:hypothetical protein
MILDFSNIKAGILISDTSTKLVGNFHVILDEFSEEKYQEEIGEEGGGGGGK